MQSTLNVGGRPVGVARTVDGHVWVADATADSVIQFEGTTGERLQRIAVGPRLTTLAATPDGHYLVLASSAPDTALHVVNLVVTHLAGADSVRHLEVPSGVLAPATGAEITRAYATTGDGNLIYWDLGANAIERSVALGRKPVGLTLGLVEPMGGVSQPASAGGGGGEGAGGAAGGSPGAAGGLGTTTGASGSTTGASDTIGGGASASTATGVGSTGVGGGTGAGTGGTGVGGTGAGASSGTGTGGTGTGGTTSGGGTGTGTGGVGTAGR